MRKNFLAKNNCIKFAHLKLILVFNVKLINNN